jgi:hypothetical protein
MQESSPSKAENQAAWNRVFEVLRPPSLDRIEFLRTGHQIQAGDFAWASPRWPEDKEGMVHLTGYDEKMLNIWYADLELSEVRYVGPKPTTFPQDKNPFPVKPPTSSVTLYMGRLKHFCLRRWGWWKARHIRRENLSKYGKPKNEQRLADLH